jgi:hypothetical protein
VENDAILGTLFEAVVVVAEGDCARFHKTGSNVQLSQMAMDFAEAGDWEAQLTAQGVREFGLS